MDEIHTIESLTRPEQRFFCKPYRTSMPARSCLVRQCTAAEATTPMERMPFARCVDCADGKNVRARVEHAPETTAPRREQAARGATETRREPMKKHSTAEIHSTRHVDPTSEWVDVTPSVAADWLKRVNINNRNINTHLVSRLASDYESGRFVQTHQGIGFDVDGNMLDGQHRLNAIVKSGVTVRLLVTRNLPREARGKIDTGTFAAGCNDEEAGAYTEAEKRLAVDEMLRIHNGWTNTRIAEHCHVTEHLVRERREASKMTRSSDSEHLPPGSTQSNVEQSPRKDAPTSKREGRDGKRYGSEGQKKSGGRRQFDNAITAIINAPTKRAVEEAYSKAKCALVKLPDDDGFRKKQADSAYRARLDELAPAPKQPQKPKRPTRRAPKSEPSEVRVARERRFRVEGAILACRNLLQKLGELLCDHPLDDADEQTRAEFKEVSDLVIRRLGEHRPPADVVSLASKKAQNGGA